MKELVADLSFGPSRTAQQPGISLEFNLPLKGPLEFGANFGPYRLMGFASSSPAVSRPQPDTLHSGAQ